MVHMLYKWWRGVFPVMWVLPAVLSMVPPERAEVHPFFVSVTEIAYNASDKTLEISCKLFTDDFEKALVKASGQPVDLYKPKDRLLLDKQVAIYMRKHLIFRVDGKDVEMEYVGHELEEQSTFVYFQVNSILQPPRKLEATNTILYEMNDKQISILHATVNNNRKSTKVEFPVSDIVFNW